MKRVLTNHVTPSANSQTNTKHYILLSCEIWKIYRYIANSAPAIAYHTFKIKAPTSTKYLKGQIMSQLNENTNEIT